MVLLEHFNDSIGPVPKDPRQALNAEERQRRDVQKTQLRLEAYSTKTQYKSYVCRAIVEFLNNPCTTRPMLERNLQLFLGGKVYDGGNLKMLRCSLDLNAPYVADFCLTAYSRMVLKVLKNETAAKTFKRRMGQVYYLKADIMCWANPADINSLVLNLLDNISVRADNMPHKLYAALSVANKARSFGISPSYVWPSPPLCLDFFIFGECAQGLRNCPRIHECAQDKRCAHKDPHSVSSCLHAKGLSDTARTRIQSNIWHKQQEREASNSANYSNYGKRKGGSKKNNNRGNNGRGRGKRY